MSKEAPLIAIDGPAAVGKGTVSRSVADRLGFRHLDSGRLYRVVAQCALIKEASLDDEQAVLSAAHLPLGDHQEMTRRLEDSGLGSEDIGQAASKVAKLPMVREALTPALHAQRTLPGIVADGRDMGSLVFPDATLKVFLAASAKVREERAKGRAKQRGGAKIIDSLGNFRDRDARDNAREIAPIVPAPDATVIDTENLSVTQVTDKIVALYAKASQS